MGFEAVVVKLWHACVVLPLVVVRGIHLIKKIIRVIYCYGLYGHVVFLVVL